MINVPNERRIYLGCNPRVANQAFESINSITLPHQATTDIGRWCLDFGQSALETARWQFRLIHFLCKHEQIFKLTLLCAASVNEADSSLENFRSMIKIASNQSSSIEFLIGLITSNNYYRLIEQKVVDTWLNDLVLARLIQFSLENFNNWTLTFGLEPEFWAVFNLEF